MRGMENVKIGEQISETNVILQLTKQSGKKFRGRRRKLCSEEFYDLY
jgi:hypothetical protein